jgi:hypothetical protein
MPRKSAAALAMAGFLPKRLWAEIVLDRPAEHFRTGTQELLASYCQVSDQLEQLWQRERECEDDRKA